MELPSISQLLSSTWARVQRFAASLGGFLYIGALLLIILIGNLSNWLLKRLPVVSPIPKHKAWLLILEKAFTRVLKVSSSLWNDLLLCTSDAEHFHATTNEERHDYVNRWLLTQGIKDAELRKRLIQAAVWQRRIMDWLDVVDALGTSKA